MPFSIHYILNHKMLLNLSNHPFESWSEKQVLAAKSSYGEIINLPFPPVDPVATSEEVAQLALQYKDIIKNICVGNASPTIHLMGEMTFSFLLASLLLKGPNSYLSSKN